MTEYKDFSGPDSSWMTWSGDGKPIEILSIETFGSLGQVRIGYQERKSEPEPTPAPPACETCGRPFT
jgi:hypothetical protein